MKTTMKIKIGQSAAEPVERHPVEVMTETLSLTAVERDGELVPAFSFSTGEGRGTSPEVVPLDELVQYSSLLSSAAENGIPERESEDEGYVPTYVILGAELHQGPYRTVRHDSGGNPVKIKGKTQYDEHGMRVHFKSRFGRGVKTQRVRPEYFADVAAFVAAIATDEQIANAQEMFEAALPGLLEARAKAAEESVKSESESVNA